MTPSHWLLMLAVNLAFGLNLVASKFVLSELPPLAFVALRFAVVLVVLAPFLRVQRGQMPVLFGVGLLMGTVHFAFLIFGLQQAADVSTVAILVQLGVPLSTLMSVLFLGEVIRWRRTLGIAFSFLGVMIIGFDPRVFGYGEAVLLVVGAALAGAAGMTLMKAHVKVDAFQLQGWLAVVAFPTLAVLSLVTETGQVEAVMTASPLVLGLVLFSAIGASLIGHGGTYELLRHYELSLVSPLLLLATVVGVVFGVLLLGDVVTPRMIIGGLVTLGGALVITLRSGSHGVAPAIDSPAVPDPEAQS
ncbi:MAG: DMT family transporter [Pseudomonadota bacterium]